jgi:hypothetical protein
LFKALIAVSLAMLACCAAAALAGPVAPPRDEPVPADWEHQDRLTMPVASRVQGVESTPPLLDTIAVEGLATLLPPESSHRAATAPHASEAAVPFVAPTQPAVIPLPSAAYVGAATGAAVLFLRRRLLRALR